jgi:hypothetical protein
MSLARDSSERYVEEAHCLLQDLCKAGISAQVQLPNMTLRDKLLPPNCTSVDFALLPLKEPRRPGAYGARIDRVSAVHTCPFAETLALDNDIHILNASRVLGWFDHLKSSTSISGIRAPVGVPKGHETKRVPSSFGEINGGVLFLRCPRVQPILDSWLSELQHKTSKDGHDQMPLRISVYKHRGSFEYAPANVMCRTVWKSSCALVHDHDRVNCPSRIRSPTPTNLVKSIVPTPSSFLRVDLWDSFTVTGAPMLATAAIGCIICCRRRNAKWGQ